MKFLKLSDVILGKDIVHVWVEDDIDEAILSMVLDVMRTDFSQRYKLTERNYVEQGAVTTLRKEGYLER